MVLYQPGGYSWLCVIPEPVRDKTPLSREEIKRLKGDCKAMAKAVYILENKVSRYQLLCEKYEKFAGTEKSGRVIEQMEHLQGEIDSLSFGLCESVKDAVDVAHKH